MKIKSKPLLIPILYIIQMLITRYLCYVEAGKKMQYHDDLIKWKRFPRYGPRWIPRTKASDAELWCFLWSAPE